jgi:NADH-quinone oxidoreductase subunit A
VTTPLWYVLGFAFAAFTFVFITIGASWLITHRHRGDRHKGLPYESGIDTYGDTRGRFGLSFYLYALLFVAFDIEIVIIALFALLFGQVANDPAALQVAGETAPTPLGMFLGLLIFVLVMEISVLYAARKGVLTWK